MGNSSSVIEEEVERRDSGTSTTIPAVAESSEKSTYSNFCVRKDSSKSGVQMWKDGIIPYEMDDSLNYNQDRILKAMKTIEEYSRMRFVKNSKERGCLKITKENGCYFYQDGVGHRRVSLGIGCEEFGTVLHELMHAIGFPHEHNRPDRDEYITIQWDNIRKGLEPQFRRLQPNEYEWSDFPFDYESIMLYEEKAFSKNGLKTIVAKDGRSIKSKHNLSEIEKAKLKCL